MPFLAVVLLLLLNSSDVPSGERNRWLSNSMLVVSALLFLALMVVQITDLLH